MTRRVGRPLHRANRRPSSGRTRSTIGTCSMSTTIRRPARSGLVPLHGRTSPAANAHRWPSGSPRSPPGRRRAGRGARGTVAARSTRCQRLRALSSSAWWTPDHCRHVTVGHGDRGDRRGSPTNAASKSGSPSARCCSNFCPGAIRRWTPIAPDISVPLRVERAVASKAVAPLRRAALMVPQRRSSIACAMDAEDRRLRRWLLFTFEPELAADGRTRSDCLHALELVASCEAWDRLRRNQGRSMGAASRIMGACLEVLLISGGARRR